MSDSREGRAGILRRQRKSLLSIVAWAVIVVASNSARPLPVPVLPEF